MTKLQWREVEATATIDLDAITEGGPDYDPEEIGDIVMPSQADTDYGIGYALDGTPVLIDGEGYGYQVPAGAIYEQAYGGKAYEVVEADEQEVLWTENLGELTYYAIGVSGGRYYFSWSEWKWPREDGGVPSENIEDGTNGIHWFGSLKEALDDARDTIEILGDVHPEWSEEALASLDDLRIKSEPEEVRTVKKQQVVTWQSPHGDKIRVTPKQERLADAAGVWPRDSRGEVYCQVAFGLHYEESTFTDAEWAELIELLKR